MMTDKIKSPIISRNKHDPTNSYRSLNKSYRNIEDRFYQIKLELKQLFDAYLIGYERESNNDYLFRQGVLYQVNSGYVYDMTPSQLSDLLKRMQDIVDDHLLEGGDNELWAFSFIEEQYRRGTHSAFTNLSHQSSYYSQQTTMTALLSTPAYQNQVMQAFLLSFAGWKGLTEVSKSDLSNVLANAITRGINPRDTAKVISKRLDVSMSKAKQLAQTEQLAAYREAHWNETNWTNDRLGLKTGLLHQSALLANSRESHVYWHGKIRTVEEVREWYSESGNRYNCHCSQIPALLNDDGEPYNKVAIDKLSKEREQWWNDLKQDKAKKNESGLSYKAPEYTNKESVKDVNKWASGKITQVSKIPNGVNINELNSCIELVSNIQERFDLPKFRYIGSISGDIYKYKRDKNMLAAFAPEVNSLLITKKSLNADVQMKSDIISKTKNYKEHSVRVANYTNNKALIKAVDEMEYVSWLAVSTPRGTFAHEMGHVLHKKYESQINKVVNDAWLDGWQFAVSKYAQDQKAEFVAESFSLFVENKKEAQKRLYPPLFELFNSIDKAK